MSHFKKMLMVPAGSTAAGMHHQKPAAGVTPAVVLPDYEVHEPGGPVLNQMALMDEQMSRILADNTLSLPLKLEKYRQTLNRYHTLRDSYLPTHQTPAVTTPAPHGVSAAELDRGRIMARIPKPLHNEAKLVLDTMAQDPNIRFTREGVLLGSDGAVLPGGDIAKLLRRIPQETAKQQQPAGFEQQFDESMNSNLSPLDSASFGTPSADAAVATTSTPHKPHIGSPSPSVFANAYDPHNIIQSILKQAQLRRNAPPVQEQDASILFSDVNISSSKDKRKYQNLINRSGRALEEASLLSGQSLGQTAAKAIGTTSVRPQRTVKQPERFTHEEYAKKSKGKVGSAKNQGGQGRAFRWKIY